MIKPQKGYKIDPTNPNQVIRDPSVITSDLLSNSNPLNVQTPPPVPQPDIKNIPITTPPVPETKPETSPFITEIETLTSKLLGKDVAKEKRITEKTADFSTSLNELNTQIKMHQANALARQEEALKSGETLRYSTGLAGQVARTDAIEAMKLSALAQGMQGNILIATKQAESAVEAEFAQTEKDLATQRQNILNNYDTFTEAEKKRADASLLALNEKDAFIARNKADREQAYKTAVEAAKNGLTDTSLLTKIQNSAPDKALELAAPFMKEKEKPTFQTFERNGHNIRQVLDAKGNVISETDLGAKEAKTTGTISEITGNLQAYAQTMADTGKIPNPTELKTAGLTAGQVAEAAKLLPKPKGALVSINTGIKPATLSATQEEGLTALNEIVQQTLPELQRIFPTLTTGIVGGIAGKLPLIGGSQARQDYNTLRQEFLNKLLKARSGAAVTEQEYARYSKLLPTTFNQPFFFGTTGEKKLESLQKAMKTSFDNALNSNQLSVYGYSKVNVGGQEYTVGQEIEVNGVRGRILPDGSIAIQ